MLTKNKKNKKKSFKFFQKSNQGEKRSFFKPFLLILLVSLILGFIFVSLNQSITKINIEGDLKRVSLKRVESIVSEATSQGFLVINLTEYKEKIEAIDWVQSVRILEQLYRIY